MKKILIITVILFLMASPFVSSSTTMSQMMQINGTANIATIFQTDTIKTQQVIEIDGQSYMELVFYDDSTKLIELEDYLNQINQYIKDHEKEWSKDDNGLSMENIVDALENAKRLRNGEIGMNDVTPEEYRILIALLSISDAQIYDFYYYNIEPALQQHDDMIQVNIYEIEALYRTMEKLHPDVYCESRKEVMEKYGLTSVVCGLHSKVCHNGDLNLAERGFSFCIYSDDMGLSEKGMGIHVKSIKIPDSEENSLTPVAIEFFNEGDETLKPKIRIDVKQMDVLKYSFEQELEEIPTRDGEMIYTVHPELISFDNSELKPGKYTAKVIISLGKKEIYDDIDFNILEKGKLKMDGKITSIESGKLLNHEDLQINVFVKNNMDIPRAFKVSGEVYRNGEKIGDVESLEKVIGPGDTQPLPVTYDIDGLGEYKIDFVLNGQKESFTFSPEPTTPTGRFISSPNGGLIGLAILSGVFGSRFYFGKKKIKRKSKK